MFSGKKMLPKCHDTNIKQYVSKAMKSFFTAALTEESRDAHDG